MTRKNPYFLSGGVYGLISIVIGLVGVLVSYLTTPNYAMFKNMISELGVGPYGLFFNLGLIFSGLLAIPCYLQLANRIYGDNSNSVKKKMGNTCAIISCIAYSLVGVFPAIKSDIVMLYIHGTMAAISLASGVGYLILYNKMMYETNSFPQVYAYLGFILAILYFACLFTWSPVVEWIVFFALTIWILLISIHMLRVK